MIGRAAAGLALAALVGGTAGAQAPAGAEPQAGPAATAAGSESVVSYTPEFFAPFNPTNARDMVDRVPGFTRDDGEDVRGFGGAAGNVLINGERPSSKSQSVGDMLERIRVADVVRIDLIRGQVAGIDMAGQTVVVNVVRRLDAAAGGSWRLEERYRPRSGELLTLGQVNWNTRVAGANVTLGLQRNGNIFGEERDEQILTPAGTVLQQEHQVRDGGFDGLIATASADRDFGAWTVRLNGRIQGFNEGGSTETGEASFSALPDPTLAYFNTFTRKTDSWEIGGDAERQLGEDLTLKLIALQSRSSDDGSGSFVQYGRDGAPVIRAQQSAAISGESILRGFLTWTPAARHSIEIGAEGAYNFLDTALDLTVDAGGGPAPIPLPVSDTRVEELRAEPYLTWLWRPADALTLEATARAEVSQIKQSGDAAQTRNFFYPSPSASLTWDLAGDTQLRLTGEREVAQLSFEEFASSVEFTDDTQDIGNPDLVPERTWRARAELEQRFWDDAVATLLFEREWIDDAQGLVPLAGGAEGPGNLGGAARWRARAELDLPLDRLGLPNGRVTAAYEVGDSEVTDPVTGAERILPVRVIGFQMGASPYNRQLFEIDFRNDHPDLGVAYGFDWQSLAATYAYRIDEVQVTDPNLGALSLFVETTRIPGLTVRLEAQDVANNGSRRVRYLFPGPRDSSAVQFIEDRRISDGPTFALTVRGTF